MSKINLDTLNDITTICECPICHKKLKASAYKPVMSLGYHMRVIYECTICHVEIYIPIDKVSWEDK